MTAIQATYGRLREQFRDYQRAAAGIVGGPALYVLLVGLGTWAVLNPETRQLFFIGVVVGSILALGALGLTLIYGVLKFGNFAHGDLMMLAGYVAFFALTGRVTGEQRDVDLIGGVEELPGAVTPISDLTFGYGLLVATVLSALVIGALSVGLDRVIYRRLRERRSGIVIFSIAALGLAIAMRSVILIFWGPDPRQYVSGIHPAQHLPFDVVLKTDQIFTFCVAVGLSALMYWVLYRTKLGWAMRAVADNADLARVSGINTEQIYTWTWLVAGFLMAVAGVLLAVQAQLDPDLGFVLLLPLFAAAILGGLGNPLGALAGAMIVGIAQEVSVEFLNPGYKPSVAFFILIGILLLRPRGLFGAKV